MRDELTTNRVASDTEMIFTRAYWRATKVLWIDIFVTIVILTGVASRL